MNRYANPSNDPLVSNEERYRSVLKQLDSCSHHDNFPVLDRPESALAATKLHIYRNAGQWALLIEVIGYRENAFATERFRIDWYLYGNCLTFEPGFVSSVKLIHRGSDMPLFAKSSRHHINPHTTYLHIRNQRVPAPLDAEQYRSCGIRPKQHPFVVGPELLRMLVLQHPDLMFAPVTLHRLYVPNQLHWLLSLSEWRHPNINQGESPSQTETFRMLARIIATGDIKHFKPSHPPNTHWTNWLPAPRS